MPLTAGFPGKIAYKNQRAHARFILTQISARAKPSPDEPVGEKDVWILETEM
jgi:hypothetical protein